MRSLFERRGQSIDITDRTKPDVVRLDLFQLAADVPFEHRHQAHDLGFQAFPILGGKCVERDRLDLQTRDSIEYYANRFGAGTMSEYTRLSTLFGPAAVTVHYHRDVPRQTRVVNAAEEFGLG